MAAGDEQQEIRKAEPVGEAWRERVGLEMIDRDERHAARERDGLPRGDPDDEPADQPGPRRGGDGIDRVPIEAGIGERLGDRCIQHLDMGACGDLRNHAAVVRMEVELRPHHIGEDRSRAIGVAAHDRGRGFVAARFDAEHGERAVDGASGHGGSLQIRPGRLKGQPDQAINGPPRPAAAVGAKPRETSACRSARF